MDDVTLKAIANLLQGGGPVVTIFAVYIAWKAGQTAKAAVDALLQSRNILLEIRDLAQKTAPAILAHSEIIERIDHRTQSIDLFIADYTTKLANLRTAVGAKV